MTVINLADRLINANATQETGKESSALVQRLETKIELTSSNKCESNQNPTKHLLPPAPSIF